MSDQPSPHPKSHDDLTRQQEAEEMLRRVKRESESIGSSAVARQAPARLETDDSIEIWGRRIGRGLGAIAVLILLWQLATLLFAGK